ncbi:CPBP family intramembrane glutamic endopeptidase [Caldalkalibacillus mannanilyticus]|uniref:CPBP family intramembrane glutamic endopeptidase n=1 Tax=Caldalkalibacillus mannanilyticus TaxID=1418 RepID=UPI00055653C4|nr:type II CAAX endopeptidase family protein [Caldalkalibacillus mannanilyticus]
MEERLTIGWKELLLFIIYYLLFQVVIGLFLGILDAFLGISVEQQFLVGHYTLLVDFGFFLILFFFYGKVRHFVLQSFQFAPMKSLRTYGYIIGGLVVFALTQYLLLFLTGLESAAQQGEDLGIKNLKTTLDYSLFFIGAALLTPLKEEFLFRGLLHRFLDLRYHFLVGLAVSSVLFGILHLGFPISATIMGAVFVILYKVTRSIVPSIVLHMIWNAIAFISIL